jgi:ABC-2 type transport system permease protein/oleandomycin transport system permease protein
VVVDAMRHLWLGAPEGSVLGAIAWSLAILVIFAPLAVSKYRTAASR